MVGIWPLEGILGRLRGHLEPSWGGVGASCRHVGSYLEPCWAISGDLGYHLGLSEALLELSWAILGALTARERPPSRSRGEGRGRGQPLPEGEEGGWKRVGPKPLTPERAGGILTSCLLPIPPSSWRSAVQVRVAYGPTEVETPPLQDKRNGGMEVIEWRGAQWQRAANELSW